MIIRTRPRILLKVVYRNLLENKEFLFTDKGITDGRLFELYKIRLGKGITHTKFKWLRTYYDKKYIKGVERFHIDLNYCFGKGYLTPLALHGLAQTTRLTPKGLAHVDFHYRLDGLVDLLLDNVLISTVVSAVFSILTALLLTALFK